jgi:hypothetical protein
MSPIFAATGLCGTMQSVTVFPDFCKAAYEA